MTDLCWKTNDTVYTILVTIGIALVAFGGYGVGYQRGAASVVMPVLDPIKDFGAVCDGKNNDTMAFEGAMRVGSNHGLTVQIPNNCTVGTLVAPSTSKTALLPHPDKDLHPDNRGSSISIICDGCLGDGK